MKLYAILNMIYMVGILAYITGLFGRKYVTSPDEFLGFRDSDKSWQSLRTPSTIRKR